MKHALVVCAALAFSASVSSQEVVVYGRVVERGAQFALACPDVLLTAPAGLLSPLVGRVVRVIGTSTGSAQAPRVAVEAVAESADVFQLSGSLRPGGDIRFRIDSPAATTYYFLLSGGSGFLPIDPLGLPVSGTFFLDVNAFAIVASGPFRQSWEVRLPIPAVRALVGLPIVAQAAVALPGTAIYVNAECATIGS